MIKKVLVSAIAVLFLTMVQTSFAEEVNLSVSGNGENSSNQISQSNNTESHVTQSNEVKIENNITTTSNTGGNTADENTGDTKISTGDVSETVNVVNTGINTNAAQTTCCPSSQSQTISGNGSNSVNSVASINSNNTSLVQLNNAIISNVLHSYSNTGQNSADKNSGDVSIFTGDIFSDTTFTNKNINLSFADILSGSSSHSTVISNNGADSVNTVTIKNIYGVDVAVYNTAHVQNEINQYNNTGKNSVDKNGGDVLIKTGDIVVTTSILNENINANITNVSCDCEEKKPEKPKPPVTPPTTTTTTTTTTSGNGKGGDGGRGGDVLGVTTGAVLPVTGTPWMAILSFVGFALLLTGLFLRYHTGIAPPALA